MTESRGSQEPQFAAFVGIDWADQKHAWCLQAADSGKRESGELEHKVETVEAWVAELCQRFGHRPIAVAVEQVKGALVFMLNKYPCLHIFPVPSTMSASLLAARHGPRPPITCFTVAPKSTCVSDRRHSLAVVRSTSRNSRRVQRCSASCSLLLR